VGITVIHLRKHGTPTHQNNPFTILCFAHSERRGNRSCGNGIEFTRSNKRDQVAPQGTFASLYWVISVVGMFAKKEALVLLNTVATTRLKESLEAANAKAMRVKSLQMFWGMADLGVFSLPFHHTFEFCSTKRLSMNLLFRGCEWVPVSYPRSGVTLFTYETNVNPNCRNAFPFVPVIAVVGVVGFCIIVVSIAIFNRNIQAKLFPFRRRPHLVINAETI